MEPAHPENGKATDRDVASAGAGSAAARERVLDDLMDVARQVRTLSDVQAERARLRTKRALDRWMASAGAGLATAVLLAGGAVLAGIGLVLRLRAVFADQPGVGELLAGALLVAVALSWAGVRKRRAERALMRRLQARHGLALQERSKAPTSAGQHHAR